MVDVIANAAAENAARQSLIESGKGAVAEKPTRVLGMLTDANYSFSRGSVLDGKIFSLGKPGQPKAMDKAMQRALKEFGDMNKSGGAMYTGDLPVGTQLSAPAIGGDMGSAVAAVSASRGDSGGGIAS